jgi:hypothetical protein
MKWERFNANGVLPLLEGPHKRQVMMHAVDAGIQARAEEECSLKAYAAHVAA